MIGFYITLPLVFIGFIRLLVVVFNYFSRPFLPNLKPNGNPLVSVLIPARNNQENIGNLIQDILNQTYKNIEVIVYDDQSTDRTYQIINDLSMKFSHVNVLKGDVLPEGWLNKNYACHKLSSIAKGEFLLFLDADVRLGQRFVEKSVSYIQRKKLILLSMFPKQHIVTFGEQITVPVMQWILLTLFPLGLVEWSKRCFFSVTNEQMMMFDAAVYCKYQWHEKFKINPALNDLISKDVKKLDLKMSTLLGSDDISCRIYRTYNDAIKGYSKNICQLFGESINTMIFFTLITTLAPILIILFQPYPFVFLYLFSIIFSRMLVAALIEQSTFRSVLLLPFQQYAFIKMVILSIKLLKEEKLNRNGRTIDVTKAK